MRQKQIIGSHFANAYECMRANQLMAEGKIRPVLWQTMGFDGVAEAHQLLHENKHLGKISILVGAESRGRGQERGRPRRDPGRGRRLRPMAEVDVATSTGTSTPFRADRWLELWEPGARRAMRASAPRAGR